MPNLEISIARDDEALHIVASHNTPPAFEEARKRGGSYRPTRKWALAAWLQPKLKTWPTLQQKNHTQSYVIRRSLLPSNLEV